MVLTFNRQRRILTIAALAVCPFLPAQTPVPDGVSVHLTVEPGTPLRLYLTRRTFFKQGAPVSAKLIEPLWAFDRIVVPAGASLKGQIADLKPVPRIVRAQALVKGDFTPLKLAQVAFFEMTLPNGEVRSLKTELSIGLRTIYVEPRPSKQKKSPTNATPATSRPPGPSTFASKVRQQVKAQVQGQRDSVVDFVRGQNKVEWTEEFLLEKLPYHPQWYRARTRIDAVLREPLDFGQTTVAPRVVQQIGGLPSTDTVAQVRLISTIDSGVSAVGDPIDGVLAKPLLAPDQSLLWPVGTRLGGKVTMVQPARYWHRGGKIRFVFDRVTVPNFPAIQNAQTAKTVQTQLSALEADPDVIKVDGEGTAKANDSKARLLRPLVAAFVAGRAADDDAGRRGINGTSTNGNSNLSGRTLGGFSGFGLFGTAASLGPRWIGQAFGYYGLAFSVYTNVIGKGLELGFEKNTATEIRIAAGPSAK